jgi:hypothetical protein
MRGGVKNDLRPMFPEDLIEPFSVADVGDDGMKREVRIIVLKFEKGFKYAVLAVPK